MTDRCPDRCPGNFMGHPILLYSAAMQLCLGNYVYRLYIVPHCKFAKAIAQLHCLGNSANLPKLPSGDIYSVQLDIS
jgi:hypothetical protein